MKPAEFLPLRTFQSLASHRIDTGWQQSLDLTRSFSYQNRNLITFGSIVVGLMFCTLLTAMRIDAQIVTSQSLAQALTSDSIRNVYGVSLLAAGISLRIWATAAIGGRKQRQVVRHGPYAFVRNPLYLGTFLIAAAAATYLQQVAFAVALVIPTLVYVVGVVPVEEQLMSLRFGQSYFDYCQVTPRWLPSLRWDYLRTSVRQIFQQPGSEDSRIAFNLKIKKANAVRREILHCSFWTGLIVFIAMFAPATS